MKRHSLLIVDDEKEILRTLELTFEADYQVFTANSALEALEILKTERQIALIIADQRMPDMTGVEMFERVIQIDPRIIRIILTGYTDNAALIDAINRGHIYQYIVKPWERQELRVMVKRALQSYELIVENQRLLEELRLANARLHDENSVLRQRIGQDARSFEIIGKSTALRSVLDQVNRVLDSSATVLLTGETGTGKTLLARYIHHHGPRRGNIFIEQNCSSLSEALLESELFGHRRGAFTGAVRDHKGLFETANGGTLLLDEISEMSPALQTKLLQVLQDGRFRRVGESNYQHADVRIIVATNRDLEQEVRAGRFRADLYYRINVFPLHMPPLRERLSDIPALVEHSLQKFGQALRRPVTGISSEALQVLCDYDYPGNIRELENLIERAVLLNTGPQLDLGEWLPMASSNHAGLSRLEQIERSEIERLLDKHAGNLGLVAQELGISRTTLWRRLRQNRLSA